MSRRLHELMDLATRGASDRVVPVDLAARSWHAGRARRRAQRRRTAVSTLAAVVALIAVAGGAGAVRLAAGPTPASSAHRSGTYPERITRLGSTDPLPVRPGPLAGLALRYLPETEGVLWTAITPDGPEWTVATDDTPSLSPDGRTLVTTHQPDGGITLHDLVTGTSRPVTGIRPRSGDATRFEAWSPDGSTLVLRTPRDQRRLTYHLLDVVRARATPGPVVPGSVIGVDDDGVVTALQTTAKGTRTRGPTGVINRTTRGGAPLGSTPLDTRQVSTGATMWAETASLGPDGTRIALIDRGGRYGGRVARPPAVLVFATEDGRLLSRTPVEDLATVGDAAVRPAWAGNDPVVLDRTGPGAASTIVVRPTGAERLVAVDPDLHLSRLSWTTEALAGPAQPARFGTRQAWWSWRPTTMVVVGWIVLLVGLAGAAVLTARIARRARW